jgi:choline dehydrogenase-like flavoprotein
MLLSVYEFHGRVPPVSTLTRDRTHFLRAVTHYRSRGRLENDDTLCVWCRREATQPIDYQQAMQAPSVAFIDGALRRCEPRRLPANPTWIPVGHETVRRIARKIDGQPSGTVGDVFNIPMTAHILGGAVIGASPESGVVDGYHRVYGYPGLHVVDGSAVPANLGVNPALTITALAERAVALWPNTGDPDPRPAAGAPYVSLEAVPPRSPAVPAHAYAALRLQGEHRS